MSHAPSDSVPVEESPPEGHLGTKWEIVLVTVFVLVTLVIGGTVWFQMRRKQRRRKQEAFDAELGHQQRAEKKDRSTSTQGDDDRGSLRMPEPTANPHRHSKMSRESATSSYEAQVKKPRYYWEPPIASKG